MKQIVIPNKCPSCGSILELINQQLFCKASTTCPAQLAGKVNHFAKALGIKGLGEATIDKLQLEHPVDIYNMTDDYVIEILGEKLGNKLLSEIERSLEAEFATVLSGLSITLIGDTASRKLADFASNFSEITREACKDAGLGDKATNNLIEWIDKNKTTISSLPFDFKPKARTTKTSNGITVCITGKLSSFPNKAAAKSKLEELGYTVVDSLTKVVTILIDESGKGSSKRTTAEERGIKIVTDLTHIKLKRYKIKMTEKVTKKWNDENTAVLVSAATAESPVSAATVEKLAEQLGFSARSIASKLRSLDYTVESLAKAHTSTFSEEETAALKEFIVANEGLYTYEEIASKLFAGKFDKRQIQGKVLSLELNTSVKATPKQAAVRTYSEAEEATFLEMAKAGAFLEDIAEKLGKQLNQVRGKALSLVQAGSLTSIPAQRESYAKAEDEDKIAALGDGIADKTIADLIALTGKTERGLKTLLTRRGIDCADYKGKAKREKADAKASA